MDQNFKDSCYFEDTVTYFLKIVLFFHRGKQISIRSLSSYNCFQVRHWCSFCTANLRILRFVSIFSAENLFTLSSINFRMVYEVYDYPQLVSRHWSMSSNILKVLYVRIILRKLWQEMIFFQVFLGLPIDMNWQRQQMDKRQLCRVA